MQRTRHGPGSPSAASGTPAPPPNMPAPHSRAGMKPSAQRRLHADLTKPATMLTNASAISAAIETGRGAGDGRHQALAIR